MKLHRHNHKLRAFTLSELIVVLALTTIIVGIAFAVLRLISRQVNAIKRMSQQEIEVRKIEQQLEIDFDKAVNVHWSDQDEALRVIQNGAIKTISMRREAGGFFTQASGLELVSKKFYLKGKEVNQGWVDALELEIESVSGRHVVFTRAHLGAVGYTNDEKLWESK